jgi:hypothetical protein
MLGMEIPVETYSELETGFVDPSELIRIAEAKKKVLRDKKRGNKSTDIVVV